MGRYVPEVLPPQPRDGVGATRRVQVVSPSVDPSAGVILTVGTQWDCTCDSLADTNNAGREAFTAGADFSSSGTRALAADQQTGDLLVLSMSELPPKR